MGFVVYPMGRLSWEIKRGPPQACPGWSPSSGDPTTCSSVFVLRIRLSPLLSCDMLFGYLRVPASAVGAGSADRSETPAGACE